MAQAAYLHIPFCEQICHYCDFNKVFLKGQPVEEYLQSMAIEMKNTLETHPTTGLNTIFVGGGTPTVLDMKQMELFLKSIHTHLKPVNDAIEYTFEANPGDLSKEKLQLLKDFGVNRLSFGVQTFDDELLKKIGRTHRHKDVLRSIELAKEVGFKNISLDLIYALPGQTIESFYHTLEIAFGLEVNHFSAYSLIIEPKTVFYNLMQKGRLTLPSQENEAEMYELLMDEMEKHGYAQYEISNFSKRGFESQHNLTYWNNDEYYGIGAGAHSYIDGQRVANAGPLKKYMSLIEESGFPYLETHQVSVSEKMEEELFLGLRKTAGISKNKFEKKYGKSIHSIFGHQISEQKDKGLLEETEEMLRLTRVGKLLGNEVFQAFIGVI
ncbi:oxygen-independent coproporphyrinogen III oxidase [Bacillus luteolus]|uniref:Heme chaperone HemW n=1 Tax=Litchfieldia luteola TaxID=682179 RepID=A0ABR9QHS5_9BACI|nr:radical SAM family heme chaperone HemW [Cytobacillus luteolus]MBE4908040.1 oxygen-independent coproporphyrinogen III oxidase [Cytobacillus luteolus]MBP1942823.1 oxygen-independent coproporphyrinogen-3 oxidase [Cytobacillus luteolus]